MYILVLSKFLCKFAESIYKKKKESYVRCIKPNAFDLTSRILYNSLDLFNFKRAHLEIKTQANKPEHLREPKSKCSKYSNLQATSSSYKETGLFAADNSAFTLSIWASISEYFRFNGCSSFSISRSCAKQAFSFFFFT